MRFRVLWDARRIDGVVTTGFSKAKEGRSELND